VQDLVAGQIDLAVANLVNSLPQMREGNIKVFAAAGKTHLVAAPEIPTVDEAGLPGFDVTTWLGMWARKGTPQNVIARLNSATVTALADPTVRMRLAELGFEIFPRDQQTPEALAVYQKVEIEKWWPIIKAAGIRQGSGLSEPRRLWRSDKVAALTLATQCSGEWQVWVRFRPLIEDMSRQVHPRRRTSPQAALLLSKALQRLSRSFTRPSVPRQRRSSTTIFRAR
jgi:hypothetical protein